jgi:hypothetical protein
MVWSCPPSPVPYWFSIVGMQGASVLVQMFGMFGVVCRGARVQRCIMCSARTKVHTAQPAPYALHSSVLVSYVWGVRGTAAAKTSNLYYPDAWLQGCKSEQYVKARSGGRYILWSYSTKRRTHAQGACIATTHPTHVLCVQV